MAGAIVKIAQDSPQGKTYKIAIFKEGYQFSTQDKEAAEYAIGKQTGTFTYLEKPYRNLSEANNAEKIIWCGNYRKNGDTDVTEETSPAKYTAVNPQEHINFFGKATTVEKLKFGYNGNTDKKNLYANGSSLTVEETVSMEGDVYPDLYGGGETSVTATNLTVKGGTFGNILGGAAAGGNVAGEKVINILKDYTAGNLKDFTALNIGTGEAGKKATLTITGKLDSDPETQTAGNSTEAAGKKSAEDTTAGKSLLQKAKNVLRAAGILPQSGEEKTAKAAAGTKAAGNGGTVYLKNAELKFTGTEAGHIGNLNADKSTENKITISKKGFVTYPVKIDGKTVLEKETIPITVVTSETEQHGDVLFEYADEINADVSKYKVLSSTYEIKKEKNKLVLKKKNTENYYVKTANGQEGFIRELVSPDYKKIINFSHTAYTPLFDSADNQWKLQGPYVGNEGAYTAPHMTNYFHPTMKKAGKTSNDGQTYDVYQWETSKEFVATYAGLKDSFQWGIVPGGLSNTELWNLYNSKNNNNMYYFNSTNEEKEEANWQKFGEGSDFYDWEKGTWVDNPKADVTIQRTDSATMQGSFQEFKDSILNPILNDILCTGVLRQRSIEFDFSKPVWPNGSMWHDGNLSTRLPDNVQVSIKNARVTGNGQSNDNKFGRVFLGNNSVLRFDNTIGLYGNVARWDCGQNILVDGDGANNTAVDIVLADKKTLAAYPGHTEDAFMVRNVDAVRVTASDHEQNNTISIGDAGNTGGPRKSIDIVLTDPNVRFHYARITGTDGVKMTISGEGELTGTLIDENMSADNANRFASDIRVSTLELKNTVGIAKKQARSVANVFIDNGELISNGSKITVKKYATGYHNNTVQELIENEVFAESTNSILDATDFEIESTETAKNKDLYFTSKFEAKEGTKGNVTIYVKKLNTLPIEVEHPDGTKHYYATYQSALTKDEMANAVQGTYIIRNMVEREFTSYDAKALKDFSNNNVSLVFESGTRTDTDGAAGKRYRVRMRVQNLELPAGVDVTFQNIVMKYDEGTNTEAKDGDGNITSYDMTFAGNGGTLTFGDGVVFLKHNDETMKPTVYGGSLKDSNLTTAKKSTVTVTAGCNAHFTAIYGGGTKEQTADAAVTILGGMVENSIYGGGDGAMVTGSVAVTVNNDNPGDENTSIYGGGKGADVIGDSTVTVTLPNKAGKSSFDLHTISGSGTDAAGGLADNVTGTKNVSIAMKDAGSTGILQLMNLTGFDNLTLGDANAKKFDDSVFKVSGRFDSRATDPAAPADVRTGKVIVDDSSLILNGNYQGHIGSMEVKGISSLSIHKINTNNTKPLLVDGTVTVADPGQPLKINAILGDETTNNEYNDIILSFREKANANPKSYTDGSDKNLTVGVKGTDILFKDPSAHTVESYVEYPGAETGTLAGTLDTTDGTSGAKILHFEYDKENEDPVRTGGDETNGGYGGYVIRILKTEAQGETVEDKEKQKKYTKTDETFRKTGKFDGSLFTDTNLQKGVDYWPITFTEQGDPNQETGVRAAEGVTGGINIDNDKYWYIAHVVCRGTDQHAFSFLVDTNAPKQVTTATTATTANVTVDEAGLDTADGTYEYTFTVKDPTVNDVTNKTPYKDNVRMNYAAHGISKVFWAVGDGNGNTKAEAEAAKRENNSYDPDGDALKGKGTISLVENDQIETVDKGHVAKVKLTVPKSVIDAANASDTTQYIWAYVKDSTNNTVKMAIPVKENVIDVKVPLKVNVVAVRKADANAQPELLAPTCYVVNNGSKEVKAEVNGFKTTAEAANLKLVEDQTSYTASEIALRLKPVAGAVNRFDETNVLKLSKTNKLYIGTMKPEKDKKALSYTFDAAYNVKEIHVPDGWISNTMSYHFTVEN